MIDLIRLYRTRLPDWLQEWIDVLVPGLHIALIVAVAWLLNALFKRGLRRLGQHYSLPPKLMAALRGTARWVITVAAALLVLGRLGVSAEVLWTAFTGFAAVGAVAFFAAWSVLSNIFCSVLILTTRPFRVHDHIEVLENGDKPGLRGRVIDINLLYTTLLEEDALRGDTVLQIPNSQFFQRTTRRWRSGSPPAASSPE